MLPQPRRASTARTEVAEILSQSVAKAQHDLVVARACTRKIVQQRRSLNRTGILKPFTLRRPSC
jgi:hypothetical protein